MLVLAVAAGAFSFSPFYLLILEMEPESCWILPTSLEIKTVIYVIWADDFYSAAQSL